MERFGFTAQFRGHYLDMYQDPMYALTSEEDLLWVSDYDHWLIDQCLRTFDSFERIDYNYLENTIFTLCTKAQEGYMSPLYYWDCYVAGKKTMPMSIEGIEGYLPSKLRIPREHQLLLPWENLHMENQLLRANLEDNLGGIIQEVGAPSDMWIENMFLKRVTEFVEQFKDPKMITPRELLGYPQYPSPDQVPAWGRKAAVSKIMKDLLKANIRVDFLAKYPFSVRYAFLVGEFLDHEFEHINLPDMFTNFIYEEFHPNHRYDIKQTINNLLCQDLFQFENKEYLATLFDKEFALNGKKACIDDFFDVLVSLKREGRFLTMYSYTIKTIEVEEKEPEKARAVVWLHDNKDDKLVIDMHFRYLDPGFDIIGIHLT
jgi:hypothetical protein